MQKAKVLIVEDDFDLSDTIKDHLKQLGCDVYTAADGLEALEMLQSNSYTCVMSDIKMPIMDGIQMISKMRAIGIETPVIFMTGYSEYSDQEIAKKGGVVLLEKPFNSEKLSEIVHSYIDLLPQAG